MGESEQELRLGGRHSLPISKLRGVPPTVRHYLKRHRITTCAQLLLAAGDAMARAALSKAMGIDEDVLLRLLQRADIARICGIGTMFGLLLEESGIADIKQLAQQTPAEMHTALRTYNFEKRISRRAPTMEEVVEWIKAAQTLPIIVTYAEPSNHCRSIDSRGEHAAVEQPVGHLEPDEVALGRHFAEARGRGMKGAKVHFAAKG